MKKEKRILILSHSEWLFLARGRNSRRNRMLARIFIPILLLGIVVVSAFLIRSFRDAEHQAQQNSSLKEQAAIASQLESEATKLEGMGKYRESLVVAAEALLRLNSLRLDATKMTDLLNKILAWYPTEVQTQIGSEEYILGFSLDDSLLLTLDKANHVLNLWNTGNWEKLGSECVPKEILSASSSELVSSLRFDSKRQHFLIMKNVEESFLYQLTATSGPGFHFAPRMQVPRQGTSLGRQNSRIAFGNGRNLILIDLASAFPDTLLNLALQDSIWQMVFSEDDSLLGIATKSKVCIVDINRARVIHSFPHFEKSRIPEGRIGFYSGRFFSLILSKPWVPQFDDFEFIKNEPIFYPIQVDLKTFRQDTVDHLISRAATLSFNNRFIGDQHRVYDLAQDEAVLQNERFASENAMNKSAVADPLMRFVVIEHPNYFDLVRFWFSGTHLRIPSPTPDVNLIFSPSGGFGYFDFQTFSLAAEGETGRHNYLFRITSPPTTTLLPDFEDANYRYWYSKGKLSRQSKQMGSVTEEFAIQFSEDCPTALYESSPDNRYLAFIHYLSSKNNAITVYDMGSGLTVPMLATAQLQGNFLVPQPILHWPAEISRRMPRSVKYVNDTTIIALSQTVSYGTEKNHDWADFFPSRHTAPNRKITLHKLIFTVQGTVLSQDSFDFPKDPQLKPEFHSIALGLILTNRSSPSVTIVTKLNLIDSGKAAIYEIYQAGPLGKIIKLAEAPKDQVPFYFDPQQKLMLTLSTGNQAAWPAYNFYKGDFQKALYGPISYAQIKVFDNESGVTGFMNHDTITFFNFKEMDHEVRFHGVRKFATSPDASAMVVTFSDRTEIRRTQDLALLYVYAGTNVIGFDISPDFSHLILTDSFPAQTQVVDLHSKTTVLFWPNYSGYTFDAEGELSRDNGTGQLGPMQIPMRKRVSTSKIYQWRSQKLLEAVGSRVNAALVDWDLIYNSTALKDFVVRRIVAPKKF